MVAASVRFLWQFITRPSEVGALAPSSRFLAKAIVDPLNVEQAKVVVELGPGTGSFTKELVKRVSSDCFLLAIERNEDFVALLRKQYPTLRLHAGSAEDAPKLLAKEGVLADAVVSGLPWVSFDEELQQHLMTAVLDSLHDEGVFATFTYSATCWLPRGRRFRKLLERSFSDVSTTQVVWRNLPPAFAYICRK